VTRPVAGEPAPIRPTWPPVSVVSEHRAPGHGTDGCLGLTRLLQVHRRRSPETGSGSHGVVASPHQHDVAKAAHESAVGSLDERASGRSRPLAACSAARAALPSSLIAERQSTGLVSTSGFDGVHLSGVAPVGRAPRVRTLFRLAELLARAAIARMESAGVTSNSVPAGEARALAHQREPNDPWRLNRQSSDEAGVARAPAAES
jgi:hypothetical protein